jgi:hypothetical protein
VWTPLTIPISAPDFFPILAPHGVDYKLSSTQNAKYNGGFFPAS